nr:ATP-binding cassette domain-containing protein [Lactococcus hodotermopsidis]
MIFEDVSVIFDAHWKLALVGRNGRGKTTLMNLLLGKLPFSGSCHSDVVFTYFPQKIADKTQLTKFILDDLYDFEDWQIQRELNLLGLSSDILWRPYETLSGGEQTKVLLAGLFLDETHFPLIDEPTNHLDTASRAKIATYLQAKNLGYIVASHDRKFLDTVSDHLLAIERNGLELLATNFSTYEVQKKQRDAFEMAENNKRKSEIGRLKKTARDKSNWSRNREKDKYGKPDKKGSGAIADTGFIGTRAARMMKKSKILERRMTSEIVEKEKLLKNLEKVDSLSIAYQPSHRKLLLNEDNMTVAFDNEQALFEPIKFQQKASQITAITGQNGIGKTQLLNKLVAIAESKKLKISRVRQIYEDNQGDLKTFAEKNQLDYTAFLNNLRKLGMAREVFNQKIEQMSMGQQKKVELAKSLSESAELYIWDEPLNYLDVFNHEQIKKLLQTIKPALIIVEHDATFIQNIADQVIDLKQVIYF